jgi:hypothetical protein
MLHTKFLSTAQVMPNLKQLYRRIRPRYGIRSPIIVYQMGKVGSSSLYAGLRALYLNVPVYQCHMLNNLDAIEESVHKMYPTAPPILPQVEIGRALRREIEQKKGTRWNLISMVREPVARNISAFFQNLKVMLPDTRELLASDRRDADWLSDEFINHFAHNAPAQWFDSQMRDVFDIDVFATRFPIERGYQTYSGPNAHLLLIRYDNLNECITPALSEFLGIHPFTLPRANVTAEKELRDLYRRFLATPLPMDYVNRMYATQYAKHFWTDAERAALTIRWTAL